MKITCLFLAVLLSYGCGGLNAAPETVAEWQFHAPDGTAPGSIPDSVHQAKFEGDLPGVAVAEGVLRVRRADPNSTPGISFAALPSLPKDQPLWLVAEIAQWRFEGKLGEFVSFGLVDQVPDPEIALSSSETNESVLAEVRLSHTGPDQAAIAGRAGGLSSTLVKPGVHVPAEEKQPAFLALFYDPVTHTYAVLTKPEGGSWRLVGRGATDPRRRPQFVRLATGGVTSDTAAEGVDIRRISVATTPPADLQPGVLPDLPFITAPFWAVSDAKTGEIIGGAGIDSPVRMASINKTMTCYVVCQLAAKDPKILDEIMTCTADSQKTPGSSSQLLEGDRLTVRDALYALMLPSANDMGVLLAGYFSPRLAPPETPLPPPIPAVRAPFIAEMNRQAKALGMKSSIFRHPSADGGFPVWIEDYKREASSTPPATKETRVDHSTTPRELLMLAQAVMQDPLFRKIVGTHDYTATIHKPDGSTRPMKLENGNRLLGHMGVDGIKTGTERSSTASENWAAGACILCSRVAGDGRVYYAAAFGCAVEARRYIDARNILEWAAREKARQASAPSAAVSGQ
ncbi:MAG: hypothetical protein WDN28_10040 [Chthoniobacter sp.]